MQDNPAILSAVQSLIEHCDALWPPRPDLPMTYVPRISTGGSHRPPSIPLFSPTGSMPPPLPGSQSARESSGSVAGSTLFGNNSNSKPPAGLYSGSTSVANRDHQSMQHNIAVALKSQTPGAVLRRMEPGKAGNSATGNITTRPAALSHGGGLDRQQSMPTSLSNSVNSTPSITPSVSPTTAARRIAERAASNNAAGGSGAFRMASPPPLPAGHQKTASLGMGVGPPPPMLGASSTTPRHSVTSSMGEFPGRSISAGSVASPPPALASAFAASPTASTGTLTPAQAKQLTLDTVSTVSQVQARVEESWRQYEKQNGLALASVRSAWNKLSGELQAANRVDPQLAAHVSRIQEEEEARLRAALQSVNDLAARLQELADSVALQAHSKLAAEEGSSSAASATGGKPERPKMNSAELLAATASPASGSTPAPGQQPPPSPKAAPFALPKQTAAQLAAAAANAAASANASPPPLFALPSATSPPSASPSPSPGAPVVLAVALFAYNAGQRAKDIALLPNDEVELIDRSDPSGWVIGKNRRTAATGYFPASYVKVKD